MKKADSKLQINGNINMKNNYKEIRIQVIKIVKEANYSPRNIFTETVWSHHIVPVVKHSLKLGRQLKADLQVLELASLLHDYAALLDKSMCAQHHIHGAKIAAEILNDLEYDKDKIKHIKDCILSHRGSVVVKRKSLEARILASADAMAHISELADMFYLSYGVYKKKTEEGAEWLLKKLDRSWRKIMPAGRKLVKEDYDIAKKILKKAVNPQNL